MLLCPLQNSAIISAGGWMQSRPVITQVFGARPDVYSQFGLKGHNGVDLRAKTPTPIFASFDGKVKVKDDGDKGYGLHIRIRSAASRREVVLGHLSSVRVKDGEEVHLGDFLGTTGNSGFSSAAHLHFGFRRLIPNNKDVFTWEVLDYDNGYNGWIDPTEWIITWKGTLRESSI